MIGKQLLRRKKKIPEKKMMKSKLISILLPLILGFMLVFGSPLKAELFSVSAGIPLSHDIKDENLDSDGVSGFFFHVKFPILVGVGLENYETKIKDLDTKIATTMYDIFYLLPIPVINLTVGLGAGQSELKCSTCSSSYDVGTATQIYSSLGFPILGIMDAHLSYRIVNSSVKSKTVQKNTKREVMCLEQESASGSNHVYKEHPAKNFLSFTGRSDSRTRSSPICKSTIFRHQPRYGHRLQCGQERGYRGFGWYHTPDSAGSKFRSKFFKIRRRQ